MKLSTPAQGIICLLSLLLSGPVFAQPAQIPYHKGAYRLESGTHSGATGLAAGDRRAFSQTVRIANAAWLQLRFGDYQLGERSSVLITSLKDGHSQRLDSASMRLWQSSSAYFNGDAVSLTLYVAAGEREISVSLTEVTVGDFVSGSAQTSQSPETICGATDDRVASSDPRVGRIVPVGCTGWIVSNGAYLTAGHCAGSNLQTFQFNVPASNSDGTINHPSPQHQYPIIGTSVEFSDDGTGNDWGVFGCAPNSNTNLLPAQAQAAFFRMSRDSSPPTIRITGYGVDGPAPNFGGLPPRNADSQTQQTHAGPNLGEISEIYFTYRVNSQGGNSGGPIIADGTTLTLGIHTHGGCTSIGGSNSGTSFENDNLENAIRAFTGAAARFTDLGHPVPVALKDGTVFRPYQTVSQSVTEVPTSGVVSIVSGVYNETMTISRAMTLTAPVGSVTIGSTAAISTGEKRADHNSKP